MERQTPTVAERFEGAMLGLALGDALGALFEGQEPEWVRNRCPTQADVLLVVSDLDLFYTDDTQMAIGVAETLIECGEIRSDVLCRHFVANYVPSRGYGRGARRIIEAMEFGEYTDDLGYLIFPGGGSYGNGGAMRVAPVGLFFRDDYDRLWQQAAASARPTHRHELGVAGAQLVALAVAIASHADPAEQLDRTAFFDELIRRNESIVYEKKLEIAAQVRSFTDLEPLGNGIEAHESAVTAIALFSLYPHSYIDVITNAILHGGDTDTIAAMAGAISGAYLGKAALPADLLARMENGPQGKDFLIDQARRLLDVYQAQ